MKKIVILLSLLVLFLSVIVISLFKKNNEILNTQQAHQNFEDEESLEDWQKAKALEDPEVLRRINITQAYLKEAGYGALTREEIDDKPEDMPWPDYVGSVIVVRSANAGKVLFDCHAILKDKEGEPLSGAVILYSLVNPYLTAREWYEYQLDEFPIVDKKVTTADDGSFYMEFGDLKGEALQINRIFVDGVNILKPTQSFVLMNTSRGTTRTASNPWVIVPD